MNTPRIIQIIPATGFTAEDRSAMLAARDKGKSGYHYEHDPLICFALVEHTDDEKTWQEVVGFSRWCGIDPDGTFAAVPLEDCVPIDTLDCGGACIDGHYATFPKSKRQAAPALLS